MHYDARRTISRRQNRRALIITLILHLVVAFFVIQSIREHTVEEDAIQIEWVELPPPAREPIRTPQIQQVEVRNEGPNRPEIVLPVLSPDNPQRLLPLDTEDPLDVKIVESEDTETLLPTAPTESGLDRGRYTRSPRGRDAIIPIIEDTDSDLTLAPDEALELSDENLVPEDRLGAVLEGKGMEIRGHIRLIRLKHSLSDWWQDPSAIPSFAKWLEENTDLRADMKYAGGALPLTDPRILSAPIVIMTGHDKDVTVGRNLASRRIAKKHR